MSIENLILCIAMVPEKDQDFANSLIEQSKKRQLTDKQLYWTQVLINRAAENHAKKTAPMQSSLNASGIMELLRRNNNAVRPKIRFLMGDVEFGLSVSGKRTRFPGTVDVKSKGRWYGRIHADGRYESNPRIDQKEHLAIIEKLDMVAKDPEKAAAEYGEKTGRCCFCTLKLDDPKSLVVGYGPICAKHYKLPWGPMTELQKEILVKRLTDAKAFGLEEVK